MTTGLVLVHGIGEQLPKAMFEAFFAGVRTLHPNAVQQEIAANAWRVTVDGRSFNVYEAHWADLLSGDDVRGTFNIEDLFDLPWYPLFNYRLRDDFRRTYSKARVRSWTTVLVALWPFVYLGHDWGWRLLLSVMSSWWDRFLDQIPGDVINFVKSAGGAYQRAPGAGPERAYRNGGYMDVDLQRLAPKSREITGRFVEVLEQATQRDQCSSIHVLAHSLGTVVAHHALARHTEARPSTAAAARITRFYTIGCPLEKIRFFWPKLFEKRVDGAVMREGRVIAEVDASLQWCNFWSQADAVSGKLSSFPGLPEPTNRPAHGLGGFFTAHVRYLGNPGVLSLVLKEALPGLRDVAGPAPSLSARTLSMIQNLSAPLAFLAFACLGIVGAGLISLGVAWVWATLLDWLGGWLGWSFLVGHFWWLKWVFCGGVAFIVFASFTVEGKNKAVRDQLAYWGPAELRSRAVVSQRPVVE
jgi:hypothetical protein